MDDFIAEHSRQWAGKTNGQNRAYLNILVEYFGPDRLLATITKPDASEVKKVLQALPASRNTKPKLKAIPLMEAIKEPGHKKIAAKTINSHIQMFKMFFDWAKRHGHAPQTLFECMKVKKDKASESERKPFAPDQAGLIYTELTENPSGLVRTESHKWGMLLGMVGHGYRRRHATSYSCRLWFARSGDRAPLFDAHAGRCPMCFQIGRVDHDGLLFAVLSGQTSHHPGEDALIAPSLPTVVERLVWAAFSGRVAPSQAIAINEDNPAQHTPIINARLAVGLGTIGLKSRHLRIC